RSRRPRRSRARRPTGAGTAPAGRGRSGRSRAGRACRAPCAAAWSPVTPGAPRAARPRQGPVGTGGVERARASCPLAGDPVAVVRAEVEDVAGHLEDADVGL